MDLESAPIPNNTCRMDLESVLISIPNNTCRMDLESVLISIPNKITYRMDLESVLIPIPDNRYKSLKAEATPTKCVT